MERILFFDGVCGLCNGFVDFALARDAKRAMRYAPLQGETARARVPGDAVDPARPGGEAAPRSVVLWEGGRIHRKSAAVLRAVMAWGGPWKAAGIFFLVPAALRDGLYDFIARRRYRWFGKSAACRVPNAAERARFLP